MKNVFKVLGIIALVAVIGFSMAACDDGNGTGGTSGGGGSGGGSSTYSLAGDWIHSYMIVSISGSTGVIEQLDPVSDDPLWNNALDKGYYKVGTKYFRNLSKTGDRTWSGQELWPLIDPSFPNVARGTDWVNINITMSTDGNSFTVHGNYDRRFIRM